MQITGTNEKELHAAWRRLYAGKLLVDAPHLGVYAPTRDGVQVLC
jgi:hypothetical protein